MVSKQIAKRPKAPARKPAAEVVEAQIAISGIPSIEEVTTALETKSKFFVADDGAEQGESILLAKLRNARGADDLAKENDLLSVSDVLGTALCIQSVDGIHNSDFKESTFGVYLVVTAVDDQGELVKLGVGSAEPFSYIVAWREWGDLPRWVRFDKAEKATRGGFYPVNVTDLGSGADGTRPF